MNSIMLSATKSNNTNTNSSVINNNISIGKPTLIDVEKMKISEEPIRDYPAIEPSAPHYREVVSTERRNIFESQLLAILIGKFQDEKALMKNILDLNKHIILSEEELTQLIGVLIDGALPIFSYDVDSTSCCTKIGVYKLIKSIKINGLDFSVAYNREYNFFSQYMISLDRVE